MNRIRKSWKNNGTPFYFSLSLNRASYVPLLTHEQVLEFDKVEFSNGLTGFDVLTEIQYVRKSLEFCDDEFLKAAVFQALVDVYRNLQYLLTIK